MTDLRSTTLRLVDVLNRLPAARRRLGEAQPGWPPTGSGRAGSGATSGEPPSSIPERTWDRLAGDPALRDAERIDELAAAVASNVAALHALVARWSAPKPGVEGPDDNDAWCRSCRRVGLAAPAERAGLCAWCRRFRYAEGDMPPVELLEARRDGRRITQAMVDAALRRR